jgi:hypothetical protein
MPYVNTEIGAWVQDRNLKAKRRAGVERFQDHPNYPAWRAALEELAHNHGLTFDFRPGFSVHYVNALVTTGADPEQIKAIHLLIFN